MICSNVEDFKLIEFSLNVAKFESFKRIGSFERFVLTVAWMVWIIKKIRFNRTIHSRIWHRSVRKQLHRGCVSVLCFQLSLVCVRVWECVWECESVCFTDGVEQWGVRSLARRSGIRSSQIHQTASNHHTVPQLGEWRVSRLWLIIDSRIRVKWV